MDNVMKKTDNIRIGNYEFDVFYQKNGARKTIFAKGTDSLYKFAEKIIKEFGFALDHCFGFYGSFEKLSNSSKAYELFVDTGDEPLSQYSKGVKKSKIHQAFTQPGEMMLFLFDYGDNHRFAVKLMHILAGKLLK